MALSEAADRRIEKLLAVAEEHGTGLPLDEIAALLPAGEAADGDPIRSVVAPPETGRIESGGRIFGNPATAARHDPSRIERGARFLRAAEDLWSRTLQAVSGLVRTVAVTGSVAFGEPREGDDCDFLVVTRTGAVWPFLLFTYLAVRRRGRADPTEDGPSGWCFNYVLDDRAADRVFRRPSGFQFAREALTVRTLRGDAFYRDLLRRSAWMEDEAAGLYVRWRAGSPEEVPRTAAAPLVVRGLNLAIYPIVAAYLQLVALRDNAKVRAAGRFEQQFQVVTRPDRLEVRSLKFARLMSLFDSAHAEVDAERTPGAPRAVPDAF